jgi:hypothetical protein
MKIIRMRLNMTPEPRSVVPNPDPVDEIQFHNAVMECVSRQVSRHGQGKVAQVMGLSVRQLSNLGAGSMPRADRLANLRALDRDALDPIHRLYGERAVPRDSVCTGDPISSKMAALLAKTIEMECPNSDGGTSATLAELLSLCGSAEDEAALRKIARALAGWLEAVDTYRCGARPNLRAVSEAGAQG